VVRGGIGRDVDTLMKSVQAANRAGCGNVISVHADVGCTNEGSGISLVELCAQVPHQKVQLSTAGALAEVGIELVLDVSEGQALTHHHAVLPDPVEEFAQVFLQCFSEPLQKPEEGPMT